MKSVVLTIAMLVGISGCAGANYAIKHYASVSPKGYTSSGSSFRIYDKPAESRLMITPSIGAAMGGGAIKGATFGIVNNLNGEALYRNAANEYLTSTNRTCTIQNISLILKPQYEVHYSCESVG